MKQQALALFQHGYLSAFAMILFMAVFIGFIYYAYSRRNKDFFEKMSNLPLNNDEKPRLKKEENLI
jgi:cbb3-type cytochrome oxidase subunit 3